jgi:hypothetical protein
MTGELTLWTVRGHAREVRCTATFVPGGTQLEVRYGHEVMLSELHADLGGLAGRADALRNLLMELGWEEGECLGRPAPRRPAPAVRRGSRARPQAVCA